jgi:hypothetical protein
MRVKLITIWICISIFLVSSALYAAALDIDSCGILGFAQETYTLTNNVSTTETTCFTVIAPDVTIDCNGFIIGINNDSNNKDSSKNTDSILNSIYSNQSNTLVKNCDTSMLIISNENHNHFSYSMNSDSNLSNNPSRRALFDIVSQIVTEPKNPGEDLIIKVSLVNFGAANQIDANLKYTITDSKGQVAMQYTKTVPVITQTEFLDHINTTLLKNGVYTLKIELTYDGQKFPASTAKVFYVGMINKFFRNSGIKTFVLPIITIILLVGVYIKSRINKSRENTLNKYNSDNNNNN